MFYLYVNKHAAYNRRLQIFFPLQTTNVACFQRKIQLPGFSVHPNGSSFQLIRISGVVMYMRK